MRRLPWPLLAAVAAGCSGSQDSNPVLRKVFGPSPSALVRQMFESPDPDLRREAIEKVSDKSWGRREPYLKGYSALATDPAPTVRSAALRALGRAGDPKYVEVVIQALTDAEPSVRWDAAVALDSLLDVRAAGPLSRAAAGDGSVDVRVAAARALRHYRQPEGVESLLHCLEDQDFSVRYQANQSLKELSGLDLPPEPQAWRRVLTERGQLPAPPAPSPRPWWDWMGVTRRSPAAQPTSKPAQSAPGEWKRPWWDWMGVTKK